MKQRVKGKLQKSHNNAYNVNMYAEKVKDNKLSLVGVSAMGFGDKISSVRGQMNARQSFQRVVIENPEPAIVFTGAENPFGKRSSWYVTADTDYVIEKVFVKFPDRPISEITYILKDIHTGRYTCKVFEAGAHNLIEKYGFRMINKIANKKEGDYIQQGDVIQHSTSYDDFGNYNTGRNARILYTVLPELTEDSIGIRKGFAQQMGYNFVNIVNVNVSKNSFLLNRYGTDEVYKSFPDIGEETVDDILCSIRENSYVSSKKEAKQVHMNDQTKYAHGTVVDIDIFTNVEIENEQFNKYYNDIKTYYNNIYAFIATIMPDETKYDTSIIDLYHTTQKYLSPATWVEKENVLDTTIRFKILTHVPIRIGQKIVGRYGNKSVISMIIDDEDMPMTDDGRPVDIIANGLSINNRIVAFAEYEGSASFIVERMSQFVSAMNQHIHEMNDENNMTRDDIMNEYVIPICTIFNKMWGKEVERIYHERPNETFDDILKHGIYIHIPPLNDECMRDSLIECYERWPEIMKKYKVYVKLRHRKVPLREKDGTIGEYAIGYQYTWVLKQEPSKAMSAVSTGKTTLYDQPVKTRQFNKSFRRYSDNPIKFGEYDTYNFLAGVSVKDFAKIATYFRGSQYTENSVLSSSLNQKIDTSKYNNFPQLDQLKNVLKFFGEAMKPDIFSYSSVGALDKSDSVLFNNVPVDISIPELRHMLIMYSYYTQFRMHKRGIMDMSEFKENMMKVEDLWIGYDDEYKKFAYERFIELLPQLEQIKEY